MTQSMEKKTIHTAYVALGANLGDAASTLRRAVCAIEALPATHLTALSSFYRTEPIESSGPDYINAVAKIETTLSAQDLLIGLQTIENRHGRIRPVGVVNAPRTLDLDVLLYDAIIQATPKLTIPHPRMMQRAFVLVPLSEIAPSLVIPGQKLPVANLLESVSSQRISRLDAPCGR